VTGISLGTFAYLKINSLNKEKHHLEALTKNQKKRLIKFNKNQIRLNTELDGLKKNKDQAYNQTMKDLIQAKENANIDALYEMGLKAMAEKDHPRAYFALAQVFKTNPTYKAIKIQYAASKKAYEKHRQTLFNTKLKTTYLKAFDQQAKSQFAQAQVNYKQVLSMKPNYKDTKARLASVNRHLDLRKKTRDLEQNKKWLEATYRIGFNAQANGHYPQAKEAYEKVLMQSPKYKDTAKRLIAVITKLPKALPVNQATPKAAPPSQSCFEKGVLFGKCSSPGKKGPSCNQLNLSQAPQECKGDPAFERGLKSVAPNDGQSLLRGLSTLLKNL